MNNSFSHNLYLNDKDNLILIEKIQYIHFKSKHNGSIF